MPKSRPIDIDPSTLTPGQWASKLAGLLSHGRTNDDPDVIACREALAYWRLRKVIDAEARQVNPGGIDALIARFRMAVPA